MILHYLQHLNDEISQGGSERRTPYLGVKIEIFPDKRRKNQTFVLNKRGHFHCDYGIIDKKMFQRVHRLGKQWIGMGHLGN